MEILKCATWASQWRGSLVECFIRFPLHVSALTDDFVSLWHTWLETHHHPRQCFCSIPWTKPVRPLALNFCCCRFRFADIRPRTSSTRESVQTHENMYYPFVSFARILISVIQLWQLVCRLPEWLMIMIAHGHRGRWRGRCYWKVWLWNEVVYLSSNVWLENALGIADCTVCLLSLAQGLVWLDAGQNDAALACFEDACAADGVNASAHFSRTVALVKVNSLRVVVED